MKLNGFVGKGSGKLGSSVFAISGGEQIVREYNPRVANPNTDAQVAQRAKMKLMSQLAAALAPGLAFKKKNLTSARNLFVSKNIGLCQYQNSKAEVDLKLLQLTGGSIAFPLIGVTEGQDHLYTITNSTPVDESIKKVIVVIAKQTENEKLSIVKVETLDVNVGGTFSTTYTNSDESLLVIYAYGWKPTASANAVAYNDYESNLEDEKATLETSLNNMLQNGVFTETSSNYIN